MIAAVLEGGAAKLKELEGNGEAGVLVGGRVVDADARVEEGGGLGVREALVRIGLCLCVALRLVCPQVRSGMSDACSVRAVRRGLGFANTLRAGLSISAVEEVMRPQWGDHGSCQSRWTLMKGETFGWARM